MTDAEHTVTIRASTYYVDDKEAFFVECRLGSWPYSTWGPFNSAKEANAVAQLLVAHFAKMAEAIVDEMKAQP